MKNETEVYKNEAPPKELIAKIASTVSDEYNLVSYDPNEFEALILDVYYGDEDDTEYVYYLHYIGDGSKPIHNPKGNTCCESMFEGYEGKHLDLSEFDTSEIKNMAGMFSECKNLVNLDLSHFDTSNVSRMDEMFSGCKNLEALDLSNFNTSKVKFMDKMFKGCGNLKTLNLSKFDTRNVWFMDEMFMDCKCIKLLDLGSFKLNGVFMSDPFNGCDALKYVHIPALKYNTKTKEDNSTVFSDAPNIIGTGTYLYSTATIKSKLRTVKYIFRKLNINMHIEYNYDSDDFLFTWSNDDTYEWGAYNKTYDKTFNEFVDLLDEYGLKEYLVPFCLEIKEYMVNDLGLTDLYINCLYYTISLFNCTPFDRYYWTLGKMRTKKG